MAHASTSFLFRNLSEEEEKEFRKWARDNFKAATDKINPIWHPVVREECMIMMEEQNRRVDKLLTPDDLPELERKYKLADELKLESFPFKGYEIHTDCAKHAINHLKEIAG